MKTVTVTILGIIAAILLIIVASAPRHALSSGTPISGYAWSDNIGWVSLNCANTQGAGCSTYGLSVDGGGNITGYAWGDNIGWISANPGDTASCGSPSATLVNGNFTGWMRALDTGGDGCISLSGSGYQATTASNPNYNNYSDTGWGSDTIGWLVFNASGGMCTPTFSCNVSGQSVNSCTGAPTTCSVGQVCVNGSGCVGVSYSGCISINSNTCSPAQKSVRIQKGSTATVYWNVANATSCSITGSDGEQWSGQPSSGTRTTSAINSSVLFKLSCDSGAFSDQATINMVPSYKEI